MKELIKAKKQEEFCKPWIMLQLMLGMLLKRSCYEVEKRMYGDFICLSCILFGFWLFYSLLFGLRRQWHPTPVLLPGKSHGQRSLVGCSLWSHLESGTTEWIHFHFSFSCIGEGNGNPLQCSCLENPRDGEPDGLPSMGSHRVGHDWSDLAAAAAEAAAAAATYF